eukprot:g8604.t1
MALDQCLREADTAKSKSALQTLKHFCIRPADDEKRSTVSLRSAVLGGLVRGRVKRVGRDIKLKRKTSVSREEEGTGKQQPTVEVRLDASPPTPPPSQDVYAESSPREAMDLSSLSLDEQRKQEPLPPVRRKVSFNEVVKEVLIEDRHKTYGNKASRRQHFYSKAELAMFKRTWYWHVKASSGHWPVNRLLRCGCPACDKDEGRVPVKEDPKDLKDEYSHWTWEGIC